MKMESFFAGYILIIIMVGFVSTLIVASCRPAQWDRENWNSVGDAAYWTVIEPERGIRCVIISKDAKSAAIDCYEVAE